MPNGHLNIIVTGASSGIGLAAAELLASQGHRVFAIARRKHLLEALPTKNKNIEIFSFDIAHKPSIDMFAQELSKRDIPINVLINNAGLYEYASLEKSTQLDELMDCNVKGTLYFTKACLPFLKNAALKKEKAKIIFVSSIGGLMGLKNMTVYCASKFAITGFSKALDREIGNTIEIATLYPAVVNNKFQSRKEAPLTKKFILFPDEVAYEIMHFINSSKKTAIIHRAFWLPYLFHFINSNLSEKIFQRMLK